MLAIIGAVVVATVFPARGSADEILDWIVKIGIGLLFFLYGTRLHPRDALTGLTHWRLHLTILAFTFVVFPLLGLALWPILPHLIGDELASGVLFLCLVPSTVQSSINFTSIARGNVAGAIVSASASNLLGVFLTPMLVLLLMNTSGDVSFSASSVITIVLQLLVPFIAGQLLQPLIGRRIAAHRSLTKFYDRAIIVLVVYAAFSEGVRQGIWGQVIWWQVVFLVVLATAMVALMLWLTGSGSKRLGFDRADSIAIQFCGTKKSLTTGLPMAAVLFDSHAVGLIVLPLMIFHQVQLMICTWLASRYSRQDFI
ncbi:bile acid:sodium symporter family protein [Williamsia sp.]|uniref:bile acid:sodium symporter family protein n=1 Tax=Williamsia sp. TaxID=1872085 RepID=UPI002F932264